MCVRAWVAGVKRLPQKEKAGLYTQAGLKNNVVTSL